MDEWIGGEETKPDWDSFYMTLAYAISQRSVDKSSVHGACLVSKDNRLLSIGYNGPIRSSSPSEDDLTTRPSKYFVMIHAEENCILNYHGSYSDLDEATIYITGEPCHRCLRTVLQKGIKKIIYGHVKSICIDEEDKRAKEIILKSLCYNVEIREYEYTYKVKDLLNKTLNYVYHKEK